MNYIRYSFLISLIGLSFFSLSCLKASSDEEEDNNLENPQEMFYYSPIPHVIGHTLSTIIKITLQKHVINRYLAPYTNNKCIAFINNRSESLLEIAEGFLLGAIRRYSEKMPLEKNLLLNCCKHGLALAGFTCAQEAVIIVTSFILSQATKSDNTDYFYGKRILRTLARLGLKSIYFKNLFLGLCIPSGTLASRKNIVIYLSGEKQIFDVNPTRLLLGERYHMVQYKNNTVTHLLIE